MSDKVSTKITFENEVYTVKDPNAINKYEDSADSKEKRGQGDVTGVLNFSNGVRLFGTEDVTKDNITEEINFGKDKADRDPVASFILLTEEEYNNLDNIDPNAFYLIQGGN